jgi:hypothetical protein
MKWSQIKYITEDILKDIRKTLFSLNFVPYKQIKVMEPNVNWKTWVSGVEHKSEI